MSLMSLEMRSPCKTLTTSQALNIAPPPKVSPARLYLFYIIIIIIISMKRTHNRSSPLLENFKGSNWRPLAAQKVCVHLPELELRTLGLTPSVPPSPTLATPPPSSLLL